MIEDISRQGFRYFDLVGHPVWAFSEDSLAIQDANTAASEWLGYSGEDLRALTIAQLRPADETEKLRSLLAEFRGEVFDAGRWTLVTRSGASRAAGIQWRRIRLDGEPAILATLMDVTRLEEISQEKISLEHKAEEASRHAALAADTFRTLFQSAPGKLAVLSPRTYRLLAVTDEYAAATFTDPANLLGQGLFEVFPDNPDDPGADGSSSLRASLKRVETLKCQDTMVVTRYPIRTPDGTFEERYWLMINKPVFDQSGTVTYIIHRVENVTGFVTGANNPTSVSREHLKLLVRLEEMQALILRLQEQDARMRTASRLLELGSWDFDLQSGQLNWSDRVFEIYGVPAEQGEPDFDGYVETVHPDDRDQMLSTFQRFVDTGAPELTFQHRVQRADGDFTHVKGVGERHTIDGREMVVGFVLDVSEFIEARQRLEEASDLLRVAGESTQLGGWRADVRTGALTWTAGTFRIHDLPPDTELTVDMALDFYIPKDRELITSRYRTCAEAGVPFDEVCQIISAKGRRVWARAVGWPVRNDEGEIIAVQGAFQDITALKEAEERAAEADRRRGEILENITDAFFALDENWRFTFVNREAERLLDRSRHDLIGKNVWEEFPEAVGSAFETEYRTVRERGRSRQFREVYPPLRRWFDVIAYPNDSGVAVFFRDATEEHRRSEQLRLLENAVNRMNDLLIITKSEPIDEPDGPKIVYVNDAFERLTGYTREEAVGRTPRMLQGERTDRKELDRIRRALETFKPVRSELINYRKSGEAIHLEIDIAPIIDRAGRYTHLVAVERDVTERKHAEEALRLSDERFRLVSRATNDVVWDWDLKKNTIWWSDTLKSVFGHRPEVLPEGTESWTDLLHPDDSEHVQNSVYAAIEGTQDHWTDEYRIRRADGSYALTIDRGFILRTADGDAVRMIGSLTDVTEQRSLEQQLRESQKLEAVGQLTGGVAHDFNNLLTIILGNAEELSERLTGEPDLRMMAEMTATAAERGAELTNRLLSFARRQALQPRNVNLNQLIQGMEPLFRRTLPETIEIRFVRATGIWMTEIDPGQLEVALLNLMVNARDAMASGGRLTIETANVHLDDTYTADQTDVRPGPYVMIAVSDTGTGMDDETVRRAFEPFFTTKEIGRGSGLGLSMVFGFVKQSRGHISIYSEPGEGTSVKLYFPRSAAELQVSEQTSPSVEIPGGSEHILIVEDDELVRQHLASQLRDLGYKVTEAGNGPDADKIFRADETIDMLLTDIVMPGGLNGRQLAENIQALRPDIAVLFTSGYTENAIVHHGRLDPDIELLSKPYRRRELALKVRKVLGAHQRKRGDDG